MEASSFCCPAGSDLGQEQVALVAVALLVAQDLRRRPRTALVLPAVEPARHRGDVRIAELGERLRGEDRPHASGAVDDDGRVLVREVRLDLELERAPWHVNGATDGALGVLLRLAHVEEHGPAGPLLDFGGFDLADMPLRLGQKIVHR